MRSAHSTQSVCPAHRIVVYPTARTDFDHTSDPTSTMKLKEIQRTATFAWGTSSDSLPLIATGTVSGALDETFSNVGHLGYLEAPAVTRRAVADFTRRVLEA